MTHRIPQKGRIADGTADWVPGKKCNRSRYQSSHCPHPVPEPPMRKLSWFARFAKTTARLTGRPMAFMLAFSVVVVWALSGPLFGFSDTWQLVINTSTTIITFL